MQSQKDRQTDQTDQAVPHSGGVVADSDVNSDDDKWPHIASELADTLNYYLEERLISLAQYADEITLFDMVM